MRVGEDWREQLKILRSSVILTLLPGQSYWLDNKITQIIFLHLLY